MKVFATEPVSAEDSRWPTRIVLDPSQPYLNDHRPGGDPLFGTVMGIEVMARMGLMVAPHQLVRTIESIENHASYVVRAGTEAALDGLLERLPAQAPDYLQCELSSVAVGQPKQLHARATVRLAAALNLPLVQKKFKVPSEPTRVGSQDIYRLFFHGPALRVVGGASWDGARLAARAALELPPCFSAGTQTTTSPRLIELALQAAGLFEIAAHRRMMIPHSIRSIERFSELDIGCGEIVWAVASRSTAGPEYALDVEVFDAQGRLHLRVSGYRTLPLPFAVDPAGPAALQQCFQ